MPRSDRKEIFSLNPFNRDKADINNIASAIRTNPMGPL